MLRMSLTTSPIFSAACASPAYSPFEAFALSTALATKAVVCASCELISAIEADSSSAEPATIETLSDASLDSRNATSACCVASCDETISAPAVDFMALVLLPTMPSISSMRSRNDGDRALGQQSAIFLRQHRVALVLEPMALGDVLVRRHPAAALHRLPRDADQAAVGKLVDPAGNFLGRMLPQRAELFVHRAGALFALEEAVHDAMRDDRFVRGPDLQQFRRQAVQAGVTVVANNQALVAVEHAQAVRHVFQRRVEAQIGLFERQLPADAGDHRDELEQREHDDNGKKDRRGVVPVRPACRGDRPSR